MFLEWAQGEHSHYRPVHPTIQQIVVPGKEAASSVQAVTSAAFILKTHYIIKTLQNPE